MKSRALRQNCWNSSRYGLGLAGASKERLFWTIAVTSLLCTSIATGSPHHESKAIVPPRFSKRVIEFDPRFVTECPEFPQSLLLLPHPTDCVKFFYCVYGRPVLYVCPPPLHFNPLLNVCDWPSRAGCRAKPTPKPTTTKPKTTKKPCKIRTTTKRPATPIVEITTNEDDLYTTDLATIEGSGL